MKEYTASGTSAYDLEEIRMDAAEWQRDLQELGIDPYLHIAAVSAVIETMFGDPIIKQMAEASAFLTGTIANQDDEAWMKANGEAVSDKRASPIA